MFLSIFFAAGVKKHFEKMRKIDSSGSLPKSPAPGDSKVDKEREKAERRKLYGKKLKLKQDNPELYDFIYKEPKDMKKSPRQATEASFNFSNALKRDSKSPRATSARRKAKEPKAGKTSHGNLLAIPGPKKERSSSSFAQRNADTPTITLHYGSKK